MPVMDPVLEAFMGMLGGFQSPLNKSQSHLGFGHWQGLPIIAIGPQGGKIVGYDSHHDPIYAGSHLAETLSKQKHVTHTPGSADQVQHVSHWLQLLGVHSWIDGKKVTLDTKDAQKLHDAFGVVVNPSGPGFSHISFTDLVAHVGHPLKPHPTKILDYAAGVATEALQAAFPSDLSTLKEEPAGKFAGSHGNKLFSAPDGRRYLFKHENVVIARAEEAASRLGTLLLGEGRVQAAKHVQLHGKDGVLILVVEDALPLGPEHKTIAPPTSVMQTHFADIVQHHALDWLIANHDAHGENFLTTSHGVVGIDKGQAWKWVGHDVLSTAYNPNPSTQLYSYFWKQVEALKLHGDPIAPLKEFFTRLDQISDEQFRALVGPYVAAYSEAKGETTSSLEQKLLMRFHSARGDFEKFLGTIYDTKIDLSPLKKVESAPPTWTPLKQGNVTVTSPGITPPPGWPKGYPGPGFVATVGYKGQPYQIQFLGEKFKATVKFPDGSEATFDSPNKASDAVYLKAKGLPITMSASEKKTKGISYPATKLLQLKAFPELLTLAAVQSVPQVKVDSEPVVSTEPQPAYVVLGSENPQDVDPLSSKGTTTVIQTLPLLDAFAYLPEVEPYQGAFKIKPTEKGYNLCFDKIASLTPGQQVQALSNFVTKYQLEKVFPNHPKSNFLGSFVTVTAQSVAVAKASVALSAAKAEPAYVEPENNFETMPDPSPALDGLKKKPVTLSNKWKLATVQAKLTALPDGAKVTLSNGKIYVRDGASFKGETGSYHSPYELATKISGVGSAVVWVGNVSPKVPVSKQKAVQKTAWTSPPVDEELKAKQAWAKQHPNLTTEQRKHAAWYLHKLGLPSTDWVVRQTPDGALIFVGENTTLEGKRVKTPHGIGVVIPWAAVQNATPEATTILGPDGAMYPYGTTFQTSMVHETLRNQLQHETGVTKIVPYSGPDPKYQETIKFVGTTAEVRAQAEALKIKYALSTPIVVGSNYTLLFVTTEQLNGPFGPGTKVVEASLPPETPPLHLLSVDSTGVVGEGLPAPTNRTELADVDAIVPHRHGYSIRFGRGGLLMDGQLRFYKVQLPDGKVVNRFAGMLTKLTPQLKDTVRFRFFSSASTTPDSLLGPPWMQHDFDPATGVHKLSTTELWHAFESQGEDLPDGAKVYRFNNITQKRMFCVDVPQGVDAETTLITALEKLGVSSEDSAPIPDERDERIMIKTQLLRSALGAKGFDEVDNLKLLSVPIEKRETLLDAALKGFVQEQTINSARVVVGHDGFHHVEASDLDDQITKTTALISGVSVEGIARAILQGGYGGQSQTLFTGNSKSLLNYGETTSGPADMKGGGGFGKFFRLVGKHVDSIDGVSVDKPKMVVHPRVLKKTNWYAANADTFGHQPGGVSYMPEQALDRKSALLTSGQTNEFIVENVSVADIAGAFVSTHSQKATFEKIMQKAGISQINGCPVSDFVIVGDVSSNLKSQLAQLPLLKGATA